MLAITPRWVLTEFYTSASQVKKMKPLIRQRLEDYDSIAIHPDLNTYGHQDNFEWKQYFFHDDDTSLSKCPFIDFQIPGSMRNKLLTWKANYGAVLTICSLLIFYGRICPVPRTIAFVVVIALSPIGPRA